MPLSRSIIVKTAFRGDLAEANTMQFVASKTNIPVPRVHCAFVHKGQSYIVMERIRGTTLAWAMADLSDQELDKILLQLRDIILELRSLPAPGGSIANCMGGSLRDSRITRPEPRFGPFPSTLLFHNWLRKGLKPEDHTDRENDEDWEDIKWMVAKQDEGFWGDPVFTHADLSPHNIMVRDGKIVAIIDWDFSGWYPSYWEYTSSFLGNQTREIWQRTIEKFLDPWVDELRMETVRQRWWGEI